MSGQINKASAGRPAQLPGGRVLKGLLLAVCLFPGILLSTAAHAQPGSGTAVIDPSTDVVAGSSGTWTFSYTATENFSTGVVRLVIPSGGPAPWSAPQILSSSTAGYVTATSDGDLNATTPIEITGRNITINVDTLSVGETVDIVYGDVSGSSSGAADVQTIVEAGVEFTVQSDPTGASPSDIASSPTLNVVAAPVSKLVFTTLERTVKADGESQVMRIQALDEFNNPSAVGSNQDVSLSSTSGAGTFSHLPEGSWSETTTVTILAGEDTVSFYYRDTSPGTYDITASADGQTWTDAQQQVTVDPGDPASLVISPEDTTVTAGEYGRFILRSVDIHGNPSSPAADQTITLLAGGGSFYDKDDHGTTVTQLVIPSGSSVAEVDFRHDVMNTAAGYFLVFLDNDGVSPLLQSTNTIVYVDHAAADTSASSIETDKATATANDVDEIGITVTVRDQFGNTVDGVNVVLEVTGTNNTITQPSGTTDTDGIATGSVRSTTAETKNIRATADGTYLEDIIGITFTAGLVDPDSSTIVAVPDTVIANGVNQTTVTVTVLDAHDNPIQGAVVQLQATGDGNTIEQPIGVTNSAGIAIGFISSTIAETKTVSATIDGSDLTPTVDVEFITGNFSVLLSEIEGDKSEVTADGVDLLGVTVTVKDDQGNPVAGASVTLEATDTGGGNTIVDPVGVTGVNGIATGTISSTVAETKTVSARVDGLLIDDTLDIDWVPGPVDIDVSTIVSDVDTVTADGSDLCRITVTVFDADSNPISGSTVLLEATDTGGGNTIFQPSAVTNENGIAVGWINSTTAEVKTVRATINSIYMTGNYDVAFIAGQPDRFVITHDGAGAAGSAEDVSLHILDANDNTVDWFDDVIRLHTDSPEMTDMITWGLGGGSSGSIVSETGDTVYYDFAPADNGMVTLLFLDERAETVTFTARYGSVVDQSAQVMTISPASADSIFVVAGDGQRAVVGQAVSQQLTVGVEDAYGNSVPDAPVRFQELMGGGTIDVDLSTGGNQEWVDTDASGVAVCESWILGTTSGEDSDRATASISLGSTTTVFFTATTDHDELASVVLTPLSGDVTVNSPTIVTATMTDQYGNSVVGENLTIFIKDAADGTLEADLSNPNPTNPLGPGIRSGTSDSTGTITVQYNSPAISGVQDVIDADHAVVTAASIDDVTYTTVASGATKLIVTDITGQPSQAGVPFSFTVRAVDSNDNLDPTNGSHIVLSPEAGGGLTFSTTPGFVSTITEADLSGGLLVLYGIGTTTGDWNVDITETTLGLSATSFPAAITANDTVHHYVINTPPGAVAGVDFPVSVEARDEWNNLVTTAGYDIDLRAVDPVDTTLAAASVLTVTSGVLSGGVFTENNQTYNMAEPIRVEISDDSTAVVIVGGVVNVDHAPAWQILEVSGDTMGVAAGDSVLLRMRVTDSFSNPVDSEMVSFSILEGGGGLAAQQRLTGTDGRTSVSYATGQAAGTNRVRAVILDGNPEGLETREFVIETVPRGTIEYVTLTITGDTFEAGEVFTGYVAAYDQYDNLMTSDSSTRLIPVALSASIDFMPDTLQLTAGEASFAASDTVMGTNRISIENLAGQVLAPFGDLLTINAGPAYELVKVSGDTTGVISGDTTEVRIRVTDMYGNPVQGEIARFLITSNLGGSPSLIDGTGAPDDGLVLSEADGTAACSLVTDTNFGTNTVLATILDGTPARETGTFDIVTTAGTISRYTVVPDGTLHTAGESFDVTITGYDLNDNIAIGDNTTIVDLGSDGTAVWAENPVTLSNGSYVVSVSEAAAGPLVLNAETQGGGALSHSDTITIVPEVPSGIISIASVVPDTITADGVSLSAITTGPVTDMYSNIVPERTRVTVTSTDGTVASEDLDPGTPDTQRETGLSGAVSVFVRSSTTPGNVGVVFQSVEGTAAGAAVLALAPVPDVQYADSIFPIFVVPGFDARFSVRVTNTSPTRVVLDASSTISFNDGLGNVFSASLGSDHSLGGGATDSLIFLDTAVPVSFDPGTYSPRVSLNGTDEYGAAYAVEFNAGINSVIVSSIEITGIQPRDVIVSRGDTAIVDVTVRNKGGAFVMVQDIHLDFAMGSYTTLPDIVPPLPDTLHVGHDETYALMVHVLPNCPLGVDTIDAWVTARVNGDDISDLSADDNYGVWTVQSAALISYETGSLAPPVVSTGQVHSFTVDLMNEGGAAVILDASQTRLSFTDGTETYSVSLGVEGALPGETVSDLIFPPATVPAAMIPGAWPVTVELVGTENGGVFDTSFVLSDLVTVVDPAAVTYISTTLVPSTVSKNSSVAFEVGIRNSGGADVILDSATTTFELDDGIDTYTAYLDGALNILLAPGDNTIWFDAVTIPPGFISGNYLPVIDLAGTENGLPFSAQPSVTDAVSVQDASQLSINSTEIEPSDLFTADQTGFRHAEIRVANNGGAVVRLDSLNVRFYVGGIEVTGEYLLTPDPDVAGIQVPGGADTLVRIMFVDAAGPMTTGTVTVESTLWGTDLNSLDQLEATTEYGGKGSFTVQTPADLVVERVIASVTEATTGQTRDWNVDVVVRNDGESDLDIDLGSAATYLTFSTSGDFSVITPAELAGGGVTLEGESSDTLRFTVDVTGTVAGDCRVNMFTEGTEINSSRVLGPVSAAAPDEAAVEIQGAAQLQVVSVTSLQDPVTIGQANEWSVDMAVTNGGGSEITLDLGSLDSTAVSVEGGIGFVFTRPAELLEGGVSLPAGGSGTLRFVVSTTGTVPAGVTALSGSVVGTEDNSGTRVHHSITGPVGENSVVFEERPVPAYAADSLTPTVASSGTDIDIQLGIFSADADHSTLILDRERTQAWFGDADGDTFRTDLSAVSDVILAGGSATTLIFNSTAVSEDLERTGYTVGIHLEGTENGNPFSADITSAPDILTIEEAPQLSIIAIEIPQSVTASLQPPWYVRMVLHNTGEASVRLTLDPDSTNVSFSIAGVGDRTFEYTVLPPTGLSGAGGLVLAGNQIDTLAFNITGTGATTGTALVNGAVTAVDINNSEILTDDTYTGGGSYMAVQDPSQPVVLETVASQDSVTSGQSSPWSVTLLVRNDGEATMTLQPGSTLVYADYALTVPSPPAAFTEGGTALAAGEAGHLEFEITPTPAISAGYDLRIDAITGFIEDNRGEYLAYDTGVEGSGYGDVRVQAPADISIVSLAGNAPRQPFVNRNQDFPLAVEITNSGEAAAELVTAGLTGDGSSSILNTPLITGTLAGGETLVDTFRVTAADAAGDEGFTTSIISAVDVNSGQPDLITVSPGADTTETMTIQDPADLAVTAVLTSQAEVNAGQTADWTIRVDLVNSGGAPATIDVPDPVDIEFLSSGSPLGGYLVVPPAAFASGAAGWTLDGGAADSLIYTVSTTGTDTGTVDVDAAISWIDNNDPGAAASTSGGSSSIYVKEPSGLRITSVTSDAPNSTLLPNTSIVNVNQIFHVTVTVENTGGDDLRDIDVSLTSNGPASITEIASSTDLPSGSSGEFVYEVSSAATGNEILTAVIEEAYSVNTGELVSPIQAVESVENVQIQMPVVLVTTTYILSPVGAIDDTVSTGQQFEFAAFVDNTGEADIDAFGQITLSLPAGFSRVYTDTDSLTMSFSAGEEIVWTLQSPDIPSASPQPVTVSVSRTPNDINIDSAAFVQKDADTVSVVTEAAAVIAGCAAVVSSPTGAVDLVLSTGQDFVVSLTVVPSANSHFNTATIALPAGFITTGGETRQLGAGDGTEKTAVWTVTAPDMDITAASILVSTAGTDMNSGVSFSGCAGVIDLDVVDRAVLDLQAAISEPPEATDGNLSVNLPFTIQATVTNVGTAGIDTTGARLEIVLPASGSYTLDGSGETLRKPFYPGQPVTWDLRAPLTAEPPSIIWVRFASPGATDENTNEAVEYSTSEVPIGVTTEAGTITMQNISHLDTIPPVVVPKGATDVPVMRVVFRNNSEYTVGLDTMYVSVEDGRGNLRSDPSRYVSAVAISAGTEIWTGQAGTRNPVPVIVGHGFTLLANASDTALVSIDVSRAAPDGELRINLAASRDVVFSIGSGGSPIAVVRDANGEDIAGFFYNTPLSIMSASFEEYAHNYPNPFRAGSEVTKITYFLTEDSRVSIKIYDYTGVLVWTKDIPAGGPGGSGEPGGTWWEADWDGRNGKGEVVRNGVYICKITAGGKSAMFKIAVAK